MRDEVKAVGVRVSLDERDVRPGVKYYDWELKGVPLRLELGKRDIEKGVVTFVRRDTGEKTMKDRKNAAAEVKDMLALIAKDMMARASREMEANIVTLDSLDNPPDKMIRVGWCGGDDCGREMETRSNMNILGTPVDDEHFSGSCVICGKPTRSPVYLAKAM